MAPAKIFPRPAIALVGRHPVVRRPGVLAQGGANVGQVFGSGDVVGGGAVIEAAGQLVLIQQDYFSRGDGLFRQAFLLLGRAVDPNDLIRLAHARHFFDPFL